LATTLRRPLRTSWLMVGMNKNKRGNLRKEVDATFVLKVSKNFLEKSERFEVSGF